MYRLSCKQVILDYLADYLDAHLNPDALVEFERHLESCAACRAYLETYKKTRHVVGRAGRVQMPQETKAYLHRFLLTHLTNARS